MDQQTAVFGCSACGGNTIPAGERCPWCWRGFPGADARAERSREISTAFRLGWHDGRHGIGPTTMRETQERYGRPIGQEGLGWDEELCSVYLNGRGDGERGETFRL